MKSGRNGSGRAGKCSGCEAVQLQWKGRRDCAAAVEGRREAAALPGQSRPSPRAWSASGRETRAWKGRSATHRCPAREQRGRRDDQSCLVYPSCHLFGRQRKSERTRRGHAAEGRGRTAAADSRSWPRRPLSSCWSAAPPTCGQSASLRAPAATRRL